MKIFTPSRIKAAAVALLLSVAGGASATVTTLFENATQGNTYLPLWVYWGDTKGTRTQFFYQASELTEVAGDGINSLTFYPFGVSEYETTGFNKAYNFNLSVKLGSTDRQSLSFNGEAEFCEDGLIEVFNGLISVAQGQTEFKIEFTTPYTYVSDNLLVDITFTEAVTGGVQQIYFRGESTAVYNGLGAHGSSPTPIGFYPTVTIDHGLPAEYAATVSPKTVDFGNVVQGESTTSVVNVKNVGLQPLSMSISGLAGTPFSAEAPSTVAPNEAVDISVTFSPEEGGNHNAVMTLDLGEAGVFEVALNGVCKVAVEGEVDVADGTATCDEVPFYMYNLDTPGMGSQILYPASMINRAVGKQISGLKFFLSGGGYGKNWEAPVVIKMGTTTENEYETAGRINANMTEVFNGTISGYASGNVLEINFDTPFIYSGDNLLLDFSLPAKGNNWLAASFYGINTSEYSSLAVKNSNDLKLERFIPHTIFYAEELKDYSAKISTQALEFKKLKLGRTQELSFTITNNGMLPIPVSMSSLEGTPFSATLSTSVLESGKSVTVPVVFEPVEAGDASATITIDAGEAGTFEIALTGSCRVTEIIDGELTLFDEDATSAYFPIYMQYGDKQGTGSQVIYTAQELSRINGKQITGLTYYIANEEGAPRDCVTPVKISLGATDKTIFDDNEFEELEMSDVFEGNLEIAEGGKIAKLVFTTPYLYSGGNLLVQIETAADDGGYMQVQFLGEESAYGSSVYRYKSYSYYMVTLGSFRPMTTFDYADPVEYGVAVSKSDIDFGTLKIGRTLTSNVTVSNYGSKDVTIALSGLDGTPYSAEIEDAAIASGKSGVITITYEPVEGGESEAVLTIDAGEAGTKEVTLKGFCKAPVLVDGEVTVADDEAKSEYVPLYFYNGDTYNMNSVVIYPASDFKHIIGKQITSLKYFCADNGGFQKTWEGSVSVQIGVTPDNVFPEIDGYPSPANISFVEVFDGTPAVIQGSNEMDITFDVPFVYPGDNLVVKIAINSPNTYMHAYFYGETYDTTEGVSTLYSSTGSSYTTLGFTPMTRFFYEDAVPYKATVSTDEIDFGVTRVNKPVKKTVKVTNAGGNSIPMTLSSLEGTPFSVTNAVNNLPVGKSLDLEVVYAPNDGGEQTATLTIDLGEAGSFDVALKGYCNAPDPGYYEVTLFEDEVKSDNVPFKMSYTDVNGTGSEFIYPEWALKDLKGQTITEMTFYIAGNGFDRLWTGGGTVKLATTELEAMGEFGDTPQFLDIEMTEVFNGEFVGEEGAKEFNIKFTSPFVYEGGNLVVKTEITNALGWCNGSFLGTEADVLNGVSTYYSYGSDNKQFQDFYPMVSITYGKDLVPGVSVSPKHVKLPDAKIGEVVETSVVLTNTADVAYSVLLSGLEDTPFSATAAEEVGAASNIAINITYAPEAVGTDKAVLMIAVGDGGSLAVDLTGTALPLSGGDTFTVDGLTYIILDDATVGIDGVANDVTECVVPATVTMSDTEYTVVSVERDAFYWSNVTSVVLPETVTEIKYGAFRSSPLASIVLPEGLKTIGEHAFRSTKLTSIVIPDGVTEIAASTFAMSESLASVTLPAALEKIGSGAFYKTALTSVVIPSTCTEIESEAFEYCQSLASVTLPDALTAISPMLFLNCSSLVSLEIPASVKEIGAQAFENSGLATLNVAAGIETIASNSFNGAPVKTITVAAGNDAFKTVDGVLYSADMRFLYLFPRTVENTVYTVNDACAGIIGGAFYGSNVTEVVLPEGLAGIDSFAFCKSDLATISFPAGMSELFEQALAGTKLTTVTLPESLTYVSDGLFAGCEQLQKVTLPASINVIGNRAFYNCTALTEIECLGETPAEFDAWETFTDPFYGVDCSKVTVYCPESALDAYKASEWADFFSGMTGVSGVAGVYADGDLAIAVNGGTFAIDLGGLTGAHVEIYTAGGSLVAVYSNASGVITTDHLQKGCYIITVIAADKHAAVKVIL